ncbi:MAG: cysteine-rich CWC family protein [Burkholderiales bacterium]|nr:cysteine-rich CWC family protein [Burkholderiales bacterium]
MNSDPLPIPAKTCPLCGGPNDCRPAADGHFEQACWCREVVFSKALLDRLPPAAKNRCCICRACAEGRTD